MLKYKASQIPSGGLEAPFSLKFLKNGLSVLIHSKFLLFWIKRKSVSDNRDSEDEVEDDYQTVFLEPEVDEDEQREKCQSDKKSDLKIDKDISVPIIID